MSKNAIYLRISSDRLGTELGVDRQRDACLALMTARGMDSPTEYMDNSVSAYSRKPRPAYQRLLADVRAGHIDTVVFYDLDRLTRRPSEAEEWVKLNEEFGVKLIATNEDIDLTQPNGRLAFRIRVDISIHEVEHKGERQKAANAQKARAGKPVTGRRPFGFQKDRMHKDPVEAPLVQGIYADFFAGKSLHGIARDLNAAGIKTSMGKPFTAVGLRHILRNPANAGIFYRHGERMPVSQIEAIVSEEDWAAAVSQLQGRIEPTGPKPSVSLLTNIMTCICGAPMVGKTVKRKGESFRIRHYLCSTKAYRDQHSTGEHVAIKAEIADDVVLEKLLEYLIEGVSTDAADSDPVDLRAVRAELADLARQQQEATELLLEPNVDKTVIRKRLADLAARVEDRTRYRDALVSRASAGSAFAEFREHFKDGMAGVGDPFIDSAVYDRATIQWTDLSLDTQRDIIRGALDVTLTKGGHGRKRVQVTRR